MTAMISPAIVVGRGTNGEQSAEVQPVPCRTAMGEVQRRAGENGWFQAADSLGHRWCRPIVVPADLRATFERILTEGRIDFWTVRTPGSQAPAHTRGAYGVVDRPARTYHVLSITTPIAPFDHGAWPHEHGGPIDLPNAEDVQHFPGEFTVDRIPAVADRLKALLRGTLVWHDEQIAVAAAEKQAHEASVERERSRRARLSPAQREAEDAAQAEQTRRAFLSPTERAIEDLTARVARLESAR